MRLEGLGHLKNPVTSSGIEPETFRLVEATLPLSQQIFMSHLEGETT
jgi:hypothetical protein